MRSFFDLSLRHKEELPINYFKTRFFSSHLLLFLYNSKKEANREWKYFARRVGLTGNAYTIFESNNKSLYSANLKMP